MPSIIKRTDATMPLAEWVNYARGTRGLRTFAAQTELSIGHLSLLETGKLKNPELKTLAKIARASEGRCNAPVLSINAP
jgi:transcriptional regulator with XRE-family HTH domain